MVDPVSEGIRYLFYCAGHFCWRDFDPLCRLRGKTRYKVVVSDHLYPPTKHLCPDGSGLLQDDNARDGLEK